MESTRKWYAIVAKPRAEGMVEMALAQRSFEVFRPRYWERRRWSDRVKAIELALFPGYVFCRMSWERRLVALTAPGVRSIVCFGDQPAEIPDAVVADLRRAVGSGLPVSPWDYFEQGDEVEIASGALAGVRGLLVDFRNSARVILRVEVLRRSVAVEVNTEDLVRVAAPPIERVAMRMGGL